MQLGELILVVAAVLAIAGCQREFANRNLEQLKPNMSQKEVESILGNPDRTEKVDLELETQKKTMTITQYPVSKRSATLPLLHLIQEQFGYIDEAAIEWVAKKLGLEPINVLELVTFYPMIRREPAGKHHIRICRTLSCAMVG